MLLGAGQREVGLLRSRASSRRASTRPVAAQAPAGVEGPAECSRHQRSSRVLAGPQSKPSVVPSASMRREVGDAAEVEHRDGATRRCEHGAMEGRHQRRALAAGRDVAAAEVGDDVDAGQLGEQRRRVELHRVAGAVELARPMPHRLAVAADRARRRRAIEAACASSDSTTSA